MNKANKFLLMIAVVAVAAGAYYLLSELHPGYEQKLTGNAAQPLQTIACETNNNNNDNRVSGGENYPKVKTTQTRKMQKTIKLLYVYI